MAGDYVSSESSNQHLHLGRPNPNFEKRIREKKKQEKKAEKARRKAERDAAKKLGVSGEVGTEEPPTDSDGSDGPDDSDGPSESAGTESAGTDETAAPGESADRPD